VASHAPELQPLVEQLVGRLFNGTEANAREALGDELCSTGVDDGAINDRGVLLDDLIDRIGRLRRSGTSDAVPIAAHRRRTTGDMRDRRPP
jgi:hypothetical protein